MTPEERAKVALWRTMAEEAKARAIRASEILDRATEHDAGIDSGALVSIALSLAVITQVVTEQLGDDR